MQDLFQAALGQLHADDQNHHCHRQPGQVLIAGVAIGVVVVGRFCCQLKAQQADHAGGRIRQVVQCVRHNGNAAEHRARRKLAQCQQQIAENAHAAGQFSVIGAHGRVVGLLVILHKQADKKLCHKKSTPFPARRKRAGGAAWRMGNPPERGFSSSRFSHGLLFCSIQQWTENAPSASRSIDSIDSKVFSAVPAKKPLSGGCRHPGPGQPRCRQCGSPRPFQCSSHSPGLPWAGPPTCGRR